MKKERTYLLITLLVTSMLITITPFVNKTFAAQPAASLPYTDTSGTLSGGNYTVRFPNPITNWNGRLILWIKGYEHNLSNLSTLWVPVGAFTNYTTSMGYAIAMSDEGSGGYNITKFIASNVELTQYLIKTYNITGKIFIVGASQGGGVSLMLGANYPNLYSGILDMSGWTDLTDAYNFKMDMVNTASDSELITKLRALGSPIPPAGFATLQAYKDTMKLRADDIVAAMNGTPGTAPKTYHDCSPTYHANISIPILTLHGTSDQQNPYSDAIAYKTAVERAGCAQYFRLYPIPGGQHVTDPPVRDERFAAFSMLVGWSDSLTSKPIDNSITYYDAYASASIDIPNTGNITKITVTPQRVVQGTQGTPNVLGITLSSPQAKGPITAVYSTNPDHASFEWFRYNSFNGSTRYTEVNGTIAVNNFFQLLPNELIIQKNATRITADYNPTTPYPILLPSELFPKSNFSIQWTMPAFHIDFDANGTLTEIITNGTSVSKWTTNTQYATYSSANATFTCTSWNNYTTTGNSVSVRPGYVSTFKAPNYDPSKMPTNPTFVIDYYTATGIAAFTIPPKGNITYLSINARHIDQGTLGPADYISISPSSPQFGVPTAAVGTASSTGLFVYTYTSPEGIAWTKARHNGTNVYTEIDGKVTINNLFFVAPNELSTQRNGNTLKVNFNPTKPIAMTLPSSFYPPANFSSTWTIPAFSIEFNTMNNLSAGKMGSGYSNLVWNSTDYFISTPANATLAIQSWNVTAFANTGVNTRPIFVETWVGPTPAPTPVPTPTATPTPTVIPTQTPAPTQPTITSAPTPTSTSKPTPIPTAVPTSSPTPTSPSQTQTPSPTAVPSTIQSEFIALPIAAVIAIIVVATIAILKKRQK